MPGFWEIGDTYVDLSYLDTAKDSDYSEYCWAKNFMDPSDIKLPCPYCISIKGINTNSITGFQHQTTNSDFACETQTIPHQYTSNPRLTNCEVTDNSGTVCSVCKSGYIIDWMNFQNVNNQKPSCLEASECNSGKKGYFYQQINLPNFTTLDTCVSCINNCEECNGLNVCTKCMSDYRDLSNGCSCNESGCSDCDDSICDKCTEENIKYVRADGSLKCFSKNANDECNYGFRKESAAAESGGMRCDHIDCITLNCERCYTDIYICEKCLPGFYTIDWSLLPTSEK